MPTQTAIEFPDERQQMSVYDLFGGGDFLELAFVGWPAHPLRLGDEVPDATIRPEFAPQLESPPQRSVVRGFALGAIGEPLGLARREGEDAVAQVEFRGPPSCPRADEPPSPAAEGLRRCLELDSSSPTRGALHSIWWSCSPERRDNARDQLAPIDSWSTLHGTYIGYPSDHLDMEVQSERHIRYAEGVPGPPLNRPHVDELTGSTGQTSAPCG